MDDGPRVRFCPVCTGRLELRRRGDYDGVLQPVCPECGFTLWQNPKPCIDALIVRDRPSPALLLGRRATDPRAGLWDTPGGFLNIGDRPEDALIRECRREAGVDVEVLEIVGAYEDEFGGTPTLTLMYHCRFVSGNPAPAGPVDRVEWFPIDALPPLASQIIERAATVLRTRLRTA